MQRTSRRAFLGLVSASLLAVPAEASACIFGRWRRRRRCFFGRRRRPVAMAPTPRAAMAAPSCAGLTCLQSLIAEVKDIQGNCVYRQYLAYECLEGGGYNTILHETDCSDIDPLPQGDCENCTQCLGTAVVVPVPILPMAANTEVQGERHSAGRALAERGMPNYGADVELRAGQKLDAKHTIALPPAQPGGNKRVARLVWVVPKDGQPYGIGFEVSKGEPTIPESRVAYKELIPRNPRSYTVTIGIGDRRRHFSLYMKR